MRYHSIDPQLFINNRKRFAEKLPSGALAIFNSNDIMPTNGDGTMSFRQNNDIFYLSGADQEETVLLLSPDSFHEKYREVLFVIETNDHIARWEGEKLTKERATELTGIKTVYWLSELESVLQTVMSEAKEVFLNDNEHYRRANEVETRDARFRRWIGEKYPLHTYRRAAPIMHELRAIKSPIEIELLRKAAEIDVEGFKRVMKFVKPGVMEYEIEAEFLHHFIRNRSRGFAYTPIIASGGNACVLHYIENNQACKDGDLLLMDVGADYANYNSDITRTIPVNGKFTSRQKEVYNAVLRVMKESLDMLRPGNQLHEYHREVGKLMTSELLGLGLLDKTDVKNENPDWPAYKKYFMHGTSHYIGLDVHDVGSWTVKMEAGNAFTCEPGIYIPEENIGIRIEDDVVITEDGLINLTEGAPKEVDEIEDWMNS